MIPLFITGLNNSKGIEKMSNVAYGIHQSFSKRLGHLVPYSEPYYCRVLMKILKNAT